MGFTGHRLAEERSLALHQEIARRLIDDPGMLETACKRVEEWCSTGSVAPHYANAWRRVLRLAPNEIAQLLCDQGEEARALRQVTPFAGVIAPRERWRIWREVAARRAGP